MLFSLKIKKIRKKHCRFAAKKEGGIFSASPKGKKIKEKKRKRQGVACSLLNFCGFGAEKKTKLQKRKEKSNQKKGLPFCGKKGGNFSGKAAKKKGGKNFVALPQKEKRKI